MKMNILVETQFDDVIKRLKTRFDDVIKWSLG